MWCDIAEQKCDFHFQVQVGLRFLATGAMYRDLADMFVISKSSVQHICYHGSAHSQGKRYNYTRQSTQWTKEVAGDPAAYIQWWNHKTTTWSHTGMARPLGGPAKTPPAVLVMPWHDEHWRWPHDEGRLDHHSWSSAQRSTSPPTHKPSSI